MKLNRLTIFTVLVVFGQTLSLSSFAQSSGVLPPPLGSDEFALSRPTMQSIEYFRTLLRFYGIEGRDVNSVGWAPGRDQGFFEHFVYPTYSFYLVSEPGQQLKELCGNQSVLLEKTRLDETIEVGCTDSPHSTYVVPSAMKRLAVVPQTLALLRARLYGWCLSHERSLPIDECKDDGLRAIDRAVFELAAIREYFDKRNYESTIRTHFWDCSSYSSPEREAAHRLKASFSVLGLK